jgi:hypothetical protein
VAADLQALLHAAAGTDELRSGARADAAAVAREEAITAAATPFHFMPKSRGASIAIAGLRSNI